MEKRKGNEYFFANYPQERTREDYQNGIRKIVALHKDMGEVVAIYRFGSISALGISDIDYFVVTNGSTDIKYKCPHDKLTEEERYLFSHYPSAIVPQRLLSQLHLLAPFFEIECVYGDGKEKITPSISKELAIIFMADIIFMAYPCVFTKILDGKRMDVRNALTVLYALRYPIELFKIMGVQRKEWNFFRGEVEALRRDWFVRGEREAELVRLLEKAVDISLTIVAAYDQYLLKKVGSSLLPNQKCWESRSKIVCFEEEYDAYSALKKMKEYKKKSKSYSILPNSIKAQLGDYASMNNLFGEYIKTYISPKRSEQGVLSDIRKQRTITMSVLLEYALKVGYRRGAFTPFNLGYLDHVGLPNRVRDIIWCCLH